VTPAGRVCNDLVDFTDFFPTLAEAGRAAPPDGAALDGRSLLPQLRGERGDPREWIFCDYNPRWGNRPPARWAMNHRYKLYADQRAFDLQKDPAEKTPLPPDRAELAPLRAALDRYSKVSPR
jgi:arylsulfatase A